MPKKCRGLRVFARSLSRLVPRRGDYSVRSYRAIPFLVVLCGVGAAMEVKLIVIGGKSSGQEVSVVGPKFFIGRSEECQLRPRSDLVSRHHAVILVEDGFVAIRDFGSKNGTFVNDERLTAERELKTGDRLKFGILEFEVQLVVHVGGKKRPKVHSVEEAAVRTVTKSVEAAAASRADTQSDDSDDIDIFDLLGTDDEPVGGRLKTQATDTAVELGLAMVDTTVLPSVKHGDSQEDADKKKAKRLPPQKPRSENTQSAADDVLRKMLGGR